jgi:hypothetical protein
MDWLTPCGVWMLHASPRNRTRSARSRITGSPREIPYGKELIFVLAERSNKRGVINCGINMFVRIPNPERFIGKVSHRLDTLYNTLQYTVAKLRCGPMFSGTKPVNARAEPPTGQWFGDQPSLQLARIPIFYQMTIICVVRTAPWPKRKLASSHRLCALVHSWSGHAKPSQLPETERSDEPGNTKPDFYQGNEDGCAVLGGWFAKRYDPEDNVCHAIEDKESKRGYPRVWFLSSTAPPRCLDNVSGD